MKEFVTAYEEIEDEEAGEESYVEFKLDGRVMRAYRPTDGQLTFITAALGRGQTDDSRVGAIINLIMQSLRPEDQDYIESRLLSRDKKQAIHPDQLEGIFEHLIEEWFARPTQPPSDSAGSQPKDGPKSKQPTTK